MKNQPKCVKEVGLTTIFKIIHSYESFLFAYTAKMLKRQDLIHPVPGNTEQWEALLYVLRSDAEINEYSLVQS